ncbi:HNH endonuclease family protein [Micromonospora sp. NPDC004551]|uniref:HNH endonuclease family protein n=1 Tax=Micromonospora sp. NPDC004551 TaxID=3154284 RepID=UPI0033A942B7
MSRTLRATAISLAAILAATLGLTHSASAAGYSASLTTAVAGLPVATEVRTGYSRDLFPHWIDADGDGCNTRNEVLYAEATTKPTISGTCTLSGGRWYSYYDNAYWTLTGDLDIDHMVPLAEAWDSGARNWTTSRRQAYTNDLGDSRALAAVTDNVNQAKGDQDPATWMPSYASARCRYIGEWVAVKVRWRLSVDSAEKSALTSWANNCPAATISVTYAY